MAKTAYALRVCEREMNYVEFRETQTHSNKDIQRTKNNLPDLGMLEPTPGRIYHNQSVTVATDGPCGIRIDDAVLCLFLLLTARGFLLFVAHNKICCV